MRYGRYRPPGPGGPAADLPGAGEVLRVAGSGAAVTIAQRVGQGASAVLFRAVSDGGDQVAVRWYRPGLRWPDAGRLRQEVADMAAGGSPHPALAWPAGIVECERAGGFGVVTRWVPERFAPFAALLRGDAGLPALRIAGWIGRECAEVFAALHARGLRFRSFDLGSLRADPGPGEIVVLADEYIGPEGEELPIHGTARFLAPELIRSAARPSAVTDLHSLAVLLFYLLVHGHPLEGKRSAAGAYQDDSDELGHLPAEPLFVFDPADSSNAPPPGDPMLAWWPVYPRFIRDLFTRAFTTGLTGPPGERVSAGRWRQAMIRLADGASDCTCGAQVIWDPGEPQARCWNCAAIPPAPPLIDLPGHIVALSEGAVLSSGHLRGDDDFRTPRAAVERHPAAPGELVLRNLTGTTWTADPAGEEHKTVAPGQAIRVRPVTINFGTTRGTIRTAQPAP